MSYKCPQTHMLLSGTFVVVVNEQTAFRGKKRGLVTLLILCAGAESAMVLINCSNGPRMHSFKLMKWLSGKSQHQTMHVALGKKCTNASGNMRQPNMHFSTHKICQSASRCFSVVVFLVALPFLHG